MTMLFQTKLPSFVIPNGASVSPGLDMKATAFDAEAITIQAPAAIVDAVTLSWEVSLNGGVDYATLKDLDGTTNIKVPAAGTAINFNGIFTGITHLRLRSSSAVTADTTFLAMKSWRA